MYIYAQIHTDKHIYTHAYARRSMRPLRFSRVYGLHRYTCAHVYFVIDFNNLNPGDSPALNATKPTGEDIIL